MLKTLTGCTEKRYRSRIWKALARELTLEVAIKPTKLQKESSRPHPSEQVLVCHRTDKTPATITFSSPRAAHAGRSKGPEKSFAILLRPLPQTTVRIDDKATGTARIATPSHLACPRRSQSDQCTNKKHDITVTPDLATEIKPRFSRPPRPTCRATMQNMRIYNNFEDADWCKEGGRGDLRAGIASLSPFKR